MSRNARMEHIQATDVTARAVTCRIVILGGEWTRTKCNYTTLRSRCNAVSIVTGRPRFDSRQGLGIFSSPPLPDRIWGPHSNPSNRHQG